MANLLQKPLAAEHIRWWQLENIKQEPEHNIEKEKECNVTISFSKSCKAILVASWQNKG